MFTIPSKENKTFYQPNTGDTFGSINSSQNIDVISNQGRLRANRSYKLDTPTLSSMVNAVTYFDFDNSGQPSVIFGNSTGIYTSITPTSTYALDATTGTPASVTDIEVFNNNIYAATSLTTVKYKAKTGNWLTLTSALTSGTTHMLQQYGDRLYVTDGNKVFSSSKTNVFVTTGSYTLDLSVFPGSIAFIKASSNRLWIGLNKSDGSKAVVFEWDGQSENLWSKNYLVEATKLINCVIKDDIPYIMDSEGRLLAYNGGGFQEVARLQDRQSSFYYSHYNGSSVFNESIMLNVNSKVYQYKKDNGIILYNTPSITTISTNEVDYGSAIDQSVSGAIIDISDFPNIGNSYYGNLIFGSKVYDDAIQVGYALCVDIGISGTDKMAAYITTPVMESSNVESVWQSIILKYKKLLDDTDKIVVKYRTILDNDLYPSSAITWISNTQFTISNAGSAPNIFDNVTIGYEVEILTGNGAGQIAHISAISNSGSTYTVTLEDTIIGVSVNDTAYVKFSNWIKLSEITQSGKQFSNIPLISLNKDIQIQFKIYFEFSNKTTLAGSFIGSFSNIEPNEFYELMVVNSTEQYAK